VSLNRSSFHDYEIRESASVGACGNMGSFRGVRREDGLPVLIHRFRPASTLMEQRPSLTASQPESFGHTFVTGFIAIIEAAGSAYLVEPLPVCVGVLSLWSELLHDDPTSAAGFARVIVFRLSDVVRRTPRACHSVHAESLILTQDGTLGVLASSIGSSSGPIWLRPHPRRGPSMQEAAVGDVVRDLLECESRMAAAAGASLLPLAERDRLTAVLHRLTHGDGMRLEEVPSSTRLGIGVRTP
jgi:hypothetical protein